MGGVGGGEVLVWETIDDKWSGDKAAYMYQNVVLTALKKKFPSRSTFTLLEDNDPTGNQSKKGKLAKLAGKMHVLAIPKPSPDLNVLDYNIWSTVEKLQENAMKAEKCETHADFIKPLDRTAFNLPASLINDAVGSLQNRCRLLLKAKGGLFVEGGRKRHLL